MKKKIDEYNRLLIPVEIRNQLNWNKGTELNFLVQDNKLILYKSENDSDLILEDQKVEVHDKPIEDLTNETKSKLQKMIEDMPYDIKKIEDNLNITALDNEIKEPIEVNLAKSDIKCSKCGDYIDVNMNMKLNDKPICRKCSNLIREELKRDILYNKRIKDIQSKLDY